MLRGVSTVRYHTTDLEAAKRWYAELLGIEPYFDRPAYVEFRLGDYQHELGLLDSRFVGELGQHDSVASPAGVVAYWQVDDVPAALERLVSGEAARGAPRFWRGVHRRLGDRSIRQRAGRNVQPALSRGVGSNDGKLRPQSF